MPILTPEERVGSTMAGKYRLERIVASGGMATVFAGVHAWTERSVAVKILNYEHARDPEVVRRFLQEARSAAQLKHPNIVDVLDMGEDDDGTVYLVLELLAGETLKARMRRGRLSTTEIGTLLVPVMRAVASAHAKSVVHRDLKPDNVFLSTDEQGRLVPKLLDFGIAKVSRDDSSSTRTGMMVGTPQYMAPEQIRGERGVGAPADVWSMGVVLHAAISGRVPFEGDSTAVVLARVITERAKPIASIEPNVSPAIAAVVDRALQYEASARFADMSEMVASLERALHPRPSVPPPPPVLAIEATDTSVSGPRSGPPSSVSEPPVTPFAWAGAGDAPPPRSRASMIAIVAIALLGVVVLAVVALGGAASTQTASPTITSTPLPPSPIVSTLPVLPAPVASPPEVAVPPPDLAPPPVVAEQLPSVALEELPVVAIEETGPVARPTPEVTVPDAPQGSHTEETPPRVRTTREPRRGTRGALILH